MALRIEGAPLLDARHGERPVRIPGLGSVVLGMGLSEPLLSGENDGVMEVALWCIVIGGVCEIIAAGWAMLRPGRDRSAAPKNPLG
ncbi:hypothetical protein EJ065_5489 [Corallococcus coralloides]|uniref:Uncharacterized protein n=1 Tax=Corallococcus coralloides TaxID=184914 RepID=A0A410RYR5_CORCK|nr:hypothetical protein [Corallococcus coralloides]QAT87023.1 hypothetical protein EJ065_5489 [Corallococcus coralloides]